MIIHTFLHITVAWVKFINTVEATLYLKYWFDSMYYMTVGTAMNINLAAAETSSSTAKITTWTNNCFNSILIIIHNYYVWYLTESPTTQEESINSAALQLTIFIASYDCAYGKRCRELWTIRLTDNTKLLSACHCCVSLMFLNAHIRFFRSILTAWFILMLWTLCLYIVWINTIHIRSCLLYV